MEELAVDARESTGIERVELRGHAEPVGEAILGILYYDKPAFTSFNVTLTGVGHHGIGSDALVALGTGAGNLRHLYFRGGWPREAAFASIVAGSPRLETFELSIVGLELTMSDKEGTDMSTAVRCLAQCNDVRKLWLWILMDFPVRENSRRLRMRAFLFVLNRGIEFASRSMVMFTSSRSSSTRISYPG